MGLSIFHPPTKRLPIWKTAKEAIVFPWKNRQITFPLIIVFSVLSTILTLLGNSLTPEDLSVWPSFWLGVVFWIPQGLLFTVFAVSCHRLLLIGKNAVNKYGLVGWAHRETRFFVWSGAVYLAASLFSGLIGAVLIFGLYAVNFVFQKIQGNAVIPDSLFPLFSSAIGMIPLAYVGARFSLVLPSTAIDLKPTLNNVWTMSTGNGWRLAFLISGLPWGFYYLEGIIFSQTEQPVWIIQFFEDFLLFIMSAIEIAILSIAFRFLSELEAPNEPVSM